MRKTTLNQWDQIQEEIILLCIQWYISYYLTYSQLKNTMQQRGFSIDNKTINYIIHDYYYLADKRSQETARNRKGGWRVVQIPFKLKGRKKYLYRALDAQGNTLDFMISGNRNIKKAKTFFSQTLSQSQTSKNFEVKHQFVDKRNKFKQKNNLKLFFGIMAGLLLFLSGSYAINLLEQQQTNKKDNINKEEKLPQNVVKNSPALESLLPSEKAFLDTISWAEGTFHPHGYYTLFGGEIVEDLTSHPQKCISFRKTCSTASGRYQILDIHAKNMSFEPENQDQWAINKLKQIGALSKIHKGDISGAIASSCKVWSSFPCHKNDTQGYYNQPIKSMKNLLIKYEERLNLYQPSKYSQTQK